MTGIALLSRAAAPLLTAWALIWLPGYRELLLMMAALGALALVSFALTGAPARSR